MADFTRAGLRPSDWWREAVRPGAEQIETITELKRLIDRLEAGESLTEDEWVSLIEGRSPELADYLFEKARCIREREYGKAVYVRGLIECSNYCKNDCLYCGIRRSNRNASRYRLSREEILSCCENGYQLGFRTFVLQGGEDPAMTDDWVMEMVQAIRAGFPDCAITLSLGEKKYDTLKRWKEAGADRYLLRHETADPCHYQQLHPKNQSLENRIACLHALKKLGYQTGSGIMVGSPGQGVAQLYQDFLFLWELQPEMIGVGPYLPHSQTPFAGETAGSLDRTLRILALLRLFFPRALLPSTTALATIHPRGRLMGILAGANVVMPNLSPVKNRKQYTLYDGKAAGGAEAMEGLELLRRELAEIGYVPSMERGDYHV